MRGITWRFIIKLGRFCSPSQSIYNFLISFKKDKNKTKIFCIGFQKTGTTSLKKALKILGYKCYKEFNWKSYWILRSKKYVEKLKKSNYDAFVDFPINSGELYKRIDVSIPKSKFILTVRDPESLKKSYQNYYKHAPWTRKFNITPQIAIKSSKDRDKEIMRYFEDKKSQLLVMNVINGDGWEKLCYFLDKPIPKKPFPHKNKGRYK